MNIKQYEALRREIRDGERGKVVASPIRGQYLTKTKTGNLATLMGIGQYLQAQSGLDLDLIDEIEAEMMDLGVHGPVQIN